jgi:hypothetical protein
LSIGGGTGHWVAVLLTGGLWMLAWPSWRVKRYSLAVNEIGKVWRRIPGGDWERADG